MSSRELSRSCCGVGRSLGALCGLLLAVIVPQTAGAAESAARPGMTYESLRALPDWSGWWGLEGPLSVEFQSQPPPWKPELRARFEKVSNSDAGGLRDLYCRPSQWRTGVCVFRAQRFPADHGSD